MAIINFFPIDEGPFSYYGSTSLFQYLEVDGAVSADSTTITGVTTLSFYDYYDPYYPYPSLDELMIADITIVGSFSYGDLGTVSGTVESITLSLEGDDLMEITDINGDAARIWALLQGGPGFQTEAFKGNDVFNGTEYGDTFFGFGGRDRMFGGDGWDDFYGGDGRDRLRGGDASDTLDGGKASDRLFGNSGRDYLYGRGGDDHIFGGNGRDWMVAGHGENTMDGGAGNDRLISAVGANMLTGGEGYDDFIFKKFGKEGQSYDHTIADFEDGDTITLTGMTRADAPEVTQVGDDVLVAFYDNSVTVLDSLLGDVESAIETYFYNYYY